MTIELASIKIVRKPWGSTDLRPWSQCGETAAPIGELWFGRADLSGPEPELLLKLLFTEQPLSIQVHPDDSYARSIGQPHGKTEAWYVIAAGDEAKVALGLTHTITSAELRTAIEDGSIANLVRWQRVEKGEAILVPAGTIHAIGAGLVIAEIQQRSDATFRMFDYERNRQLHIDDAVGVAVPGPAATKLAPVQLSQSRRLLAQSPYFILEHIDLPANSKWELDVEAEAWVLSLAGEASFDRLSVSVGQAVFLQAQSARFRAGPGGLEGLVAYVASEPFAGLLRHTEDVAGIPAERRREIEELPT